MQQMWTDLKEWLEQQDRYLGPQEVLDEMTELEHKHNIVTRPVFRDGAWHEEPC